MRISAGLIALLGVLLVLNDRYFTKRLRDDKTLQSTEATLLVITDLLQIAYDRGGYSAVREILERQLSSHGGSVVYVLRDPTGKVLGTNLRELLGSDGPHIEEEALATLPPVGQVVGTQFEYESADFDHDFVSVVYRGLQFPDGNEVIVGLNTGYLRAAVGLLEDAHSLTIHTVLLIGVCAILAVAYLIYRLNLIADKTREIIETGDLAQRIPLRSRHDDFGQLSTLLNTMLARIESQMNSVRHVADNLAHDLRTPLTRLRNRLEGLRTAAAPTPQEIESLIAEADNILGIFNSLLHIANVEKGGLRPTFATIDVKTLLGDLSETYEPLASERGLTLVAESEPISIQGEKHLLFQALANLVDNAIKFTPPGGRIAMAARRTETGVLVTVADSGPGIPEAMSEKVFERFQRLDSSRHLPGNGLGLSLVRAVVQLHRGRVRLADNAPGLRVEIELPAQA